MRIRYKQSCLIILRHISDRVINKHCKINEEKCDLQFPLIGKALAVPRHKVTALGLRRWGTGTRAGPLSLQCSSPSCAQLCPGLLTPAFCPLGDWQAKMAGGKARNGSGLMASGLTPLV